MTKSGEKHEEEEMEATPPSELRSCPPKLNVCFFIVNKHQIGVHRQVTVVAVGE